MFPEGWIPVTYTSLGYLYRAYNCELDLGNFSQTECTAGEYIMHYRDRLIELGRLDEVNQLDKESEEIRILCNPNHKLKTGNQILML